MLQAALDGLGFAVAPVSLITHDLASGQLVSPLPSLRLPLLVYLNALAPDPSPETLRFVQWLQDKDQRLSGRPGQGTRPHVPVLPDFLTNRAVF